MPNRYVRESAIESVPVNTVGWQAEVFWRRLINRVDDFGRTEAHPALLRAKIFPLQLNKVRDADVSRLLLECEQAGLLYAYCVEGKQYLQMQKWEVGRAKESKHPPPPEQMFASVNGCIQAQTNVPDSDSDSDTVLQSVSTKPPSELPPTKRVVWSAGDGFGGLIEADWKRWKGAYPAVNLKSEVKRASEWLLANPKKVKKQPYRFLTNWLSRCQEKGGSAPSRNPNQVHRGVPPQKKVGDFS